MLLLLFQTKKKPSFLPTQSRVKRSLNGDLSCSTNASPRVHPIHRRQSSTDLFNELDHMRTLLHESKERECKLNVELAECKRSKSEVDELVKKVALLEEEKTSLTQQLAALTCGVSERQEEVVKVEKKDSSVQSLELEVVELRRLNKELQMQKRNLTCRVSSPESKLPRVDNSSESDIVAKFKAEASLLRLTNEDLSMQVEGLQISRLNEVEELAYLRWVNSCLRNELKNSCSALDFDKLSSPQSTVSNHGDSVSSFSDQNNSSADSHQNLLIIHIKIC